MSIMLVTAWIALQRAIELLSFLVQKIACRIEGIGLGTEAAGGLQRAANRVVLIGQVTTAGIVDIGQLTHGVVLILTLEQGDIAVMATQQLLLQTSHWIPRLGLHQLVTLMADHFTVQVITLVDQRFMLVEGHAQHLTAAVGEHADLVPIRADGRDAVVEHVVLVLPHRDQYYRGTKVVLVLAGQRCRSA